MGTAMTSSALICVMCCFTHLFVTFRLKARIFHAVPCKQSDYMGRCYIRHSVFCIGSCSFWLYANSHRGSPLHLPQPLTGWSASSNRQFNRLAGCHITHLAVCLQVISQAWEVRTGRTYWETRITNNTLTRLPLIKLNICQYRIIIKFKSNLRERQIRKDTYERREDGRMLL